jgi:hypothetical protein
MRSDELPQSTNFVYCTTSTLKRISLENLALALIKSGIKWRVDICSLSNFHGTALVSIAFFAISSTFVLNKLNNDNYLL